MAENSSFFTYSGEWLSVMCNPVFLHVECPSCCLTNSKEGKNLSHRYSVTLHKYLSCNTTIRLISHGHSLPLHSHTARSNITTRISDTQPADNTVNVHLTDRATVVPQLTVAENNVRLFYRTAFLHQTTTRCINDEDWPTHTSADRRTHSW